MIVKNLFSCLHTCPFIYIYISIPKPHPSPPPPALGTAARSPFAFLLYSYYTLYQRTVRLFALKISLKSIVSKDRRCHTTVTSSCASFII